LIKGRYDFNGDGKDDIAYKVGTALYVALGTNTGFSTPYNTGSLGGLIDRFLPNGRAAILSAVSGVLWIYRWDDASAAFVSYNTGIASTSLGTSKDYNGDGLADLIQISSSGLYIQVRANTSSGTTGTLAFASSWTNTAAAPAGYKYGGFVAGSGMGLRHADINGDGRHDVSVVLILQSDESSIYSAVAFGSSSGFTLQASNYWVYGIQSNSPYINLNGDECTDQIVGTTVKVSACNGNYASTVNLYVTPLQLLDWNGDGKTDFLVNDGANFFRVYMSTGNGIDINYIATNLSTTGTYFDADLDGDGLDDLVKTNGTAAINLLDTYTRRYCSRLCHQYAGPSLKRH
jgi:hypothetical protein